MPEQTGLAEETYKAACHAGSDFRLGPTSHWVQSQVSSGGQAGAHLETQLDWGWIGFNLPTQGGLISL